MTGTLVAVFIALMLIREATIRGPCAALRLIVVSLAGGIVAFLAG